MRWEDERYVRLYTRDTVDWLALSFEAQGLLALILRKADRAGVVKLGRHGKRGIAAAIGHAHRWETIEPALEELLADGVIALRGDAGVFPNFIEAQEALQSDTARKRSQRERDRDKAMAEGLPERTSQAMVDFLAQQSRNPDGMSRGVTETAPMSQNVTESQNLSRPVVTQGGHAGKVTPSRAVPSVPCRAEKTDLSTLSTPSTVPDSVAAMSGVHVPAVADGAVEDKRQAENAPLRVFEHWRRVMGKDGHAKFKGKRRRAVEARLKDGYTADQLCAAVDGCALTPFNMGQNERGQRYDELELICRDVERVDRFVGNAKDPPKVRVADIRKAPVRAEDVPAEAFARTGDVTSEW